MNPRKFLTYGILLALITTGVSMAYAINIQLAGNVQVDENLNVDGTITGDTISSLENQISIIENDVMVLEENQLVPFIAHVGLGGTCDEAGSGSDTDELIVNGTGYKFVLTGTVFRFIGVDEASDAIKITRIQNEFSLYQTVSIDMSGSHSASGFPVVFDALGAQLDSSDPSGSAGTLPRQIVSNGNEIGIQITCDAGSTEDIVFGNGVTSVWGWKSPSDTITVTWNE